MTATERQVRANAADALCSAAFAQALDGADATGIALVAVGGYGRRELAPYSDLDLVLVHADEVDASRVAGTLWYPLWDAGAAIDHSVRSLSGAAAVARQDLRTGLGLLDARHLAGDPSLTLRLRGSLLTEWRGDARERLPELRDLVTRRGTLLGELSHAAVPDLKESTGGLRDATVLKALVASWLVDVPHAELEQARVPLLDVRDALQAVAGRRTDRVGPEMWGDLAAELGLPDAGAAQLRVRGLGRRITHLSRLTWRRVEHVLARPVSRVGRTPGLEPVATGVAIASGEVVLDRGAEPRRDPLLLLRAAAEAAERGRVLSPPTAARLARECPPLQSPWSAEARRLLVRLLAAGPGLLSVWETLDETGTLQRLLPEWERVRLLPHATEVHRFTVDRHLVETCIEAAGLIRRVARPDVLMCAALLHDIGKGDLRDHSVVGEPIAAEVAGRMGFTGPEAALVARLVRWHLLLPEVATTRDLEDPATIDHVAERVGDLETLDLLTVLTEADARATSPKAWTRWRAGLVEQLVSRTRVALTRSTGGAPNASPSQRSLTTVEIPAAVRADASRLEVRVEVRVEAQGTGSRVTVESGDRVGLLAATAAAFAVRRVSVRSARAWMDEPYAVSEWEVDDTTLDAATLRQQIGGFLTGSTDPRPKLSRGDQRLDPSVEVRPEASEQATVIEVRADDRRGVVYLVCTALADLNLAVRSAHVTTLGPQAVDVFYVQEAGAGALRDERAAAAAHAVRKALS